MQVKWKFKMKLAELVEARLDPFHAKCLIDSIDPLDIADAEC